jgi:hypothetical protein
MARLVLMGLVLLGGCTGLDGPYKHMAKPTLLTGPGLTIREQEDRGRDRLALPESSLDIGRMSVGPPTYAENPAYRGQYPH